MSVNAAAFDVCSILVVGGCLVTVLGRAPRMTVVGAVLTVLAIALLLLISGADLLALILLVGLLACVAGLTVAGRRGAFGGELVAIAWGPWPLGIVVAAATVAVLDGTILVSDTAFHRGDQSASLISLFHYRAPVAGGLIVVVLAVSVAVALLIGRVAPDEVAAAQARQAREERQQRMQRRRQDRAAAREQRRAARSGGG